MERVPITLEGLKNLEDELQRLKAVERPRIIAAISEARAHGDLSENAEYHAAKEQQGRCRTDTPDTLLRAVLGVDSRCRNTTPWLIPSPAAPF